MDGYTTFKALSHDAYMMKIPMLGKLRGLRTKARKEYLVNIKQVPRDSREVGGNCIYVKPSGGVIIAQPGGRIMVVKGGND